MNNKIYIEIIGVAILLIIGVLGIWFFFFRSIATVSTTGTGSSGFNVNIPSANNTTTAPTDTNGSQTINTTTNAAQKIFEITAGPVVGATLLQTLRPTTTIARFIRQDDGHVYDVPLGVAGAVPKVVSNITIPGGQRAIWLEGGNAAVMQYLDDNMVVKTVYMGFPQATTSTAVLPTKIQFLPDNLVDIAASPDGKSVAYLIKTAAGSDVYIAKSDGTASRKTSSLPLSQLNLSWPSTNTILAQTTSAAGVTGIVLSINAKTGGVTQLVSGQGITASGNPTFSLLVYQIADGSALTTYLHSVQNGLDMRLPINPLPEQCIWSVQIATVAYCAAPKDAVPANFVDLRHAGESSATDVIFKVFTNLASISAVASPGSNDGGTAADILEMALSPSEQYLSYVTKGDHSLWGVLLSQ